MPSYRESFVFHLATDEPAIFWTAPGDLYLAADDVLPEPAIALGGGELIDLPDLEALINGVAQRVEIRVSGVGPETLRFAQEEADQVPGAAVHIGRVEFDEEWQLAGPVVWEWEGEAQKLTVGSEPASGGGRTRTITLQVAAGDTTRARAPFAFFTDADQRREYPTDAFFDHVGSINSGTSRRWGPSG